MTDTPEPPPLTEREKAELACFHGAFGINHRALARLRWLEAENAALKAKFQGLNDAFEEACGELPDGWMVLIYLERGAGWVELSDPDGDCIEVHEDETSVSDLVREAIRRAKEGQR
jgi:hypothetical protein